jgi:hypothetical protein
MRQKYSTIMSDDQSTGPVPKEDAVKSKAFAPNEPPLSDVASKKEAAEEPSAATKLYIKEELEAARGYSLKLYGIIGLLLSLVTGLGAFGSARAYINEQFHNPLFTDIQGRATKAADDAETQRKRASDAADGAEGQRARAAKAADGAEAQESRGKQLVDAIEKLKEAAEKQGEITRIETDIFHVPQQNFKILQKDGFFGAPLKRMSEEIKFARPFKNRPVVFLTWVSEDVTLGNDRRIFVECIPEDTQTDHFYIQIRCLLPEELSSNSSVRWLAIGQ